MENENIFLKRHCILKDKLIPWQGRIARLKMAIDVTEREIVSQAVQKKLEFEQAVVETCTTLANDCNVEQAVYNVLKIIGKFSQSDRVYILTPDENEELWNLSWEWCAEGKDSIAKCFPMTLEEIKAKGNVCAITAPIKRKKQVIGFLCADNSCQKIDSESLIKTIAYFLSYRIIDEKIQIKAELSD